VPIPGESSGSNQKMIERTLSGFKFFDPSSNTIDFKVGHSDEGVKYIAA